MNAAANDGCLLLMGNASRLSCSSSSPRTRSRRSSRQVPWRGRSPGLGHHRRRVRQRPRSGWGWGTRAGDV